MYKWHIKVAEWIIMGMFVAIVVTTFIQIIFRYVINYSLPWADELARYCFVWLVYSGIVVSLNRGEHAVVNLLTDNLPVSLRKIVVTIADILVLVLFVCITIGAIKFVMISVGQYTSAMRIPKFVVYLALPFCGFVMVYEVIIKLFNRFICKKECQN